MEMPAVLMAAAYDKAARLVRHNRRIIRVRIDFEHKRARHCLRPAIASGRVELRGSGLVARATASTLSDSLDRLVEKLERMLRERTKRRVNRRNDRPRGREFRDLIAPPAAALARIHSTPLR